MNLRLLLCSCWFILHICSWRFPRMPNATFTHLALRNHCRRRYDAWSRKSLRTVNNLDGRCRNPLPWNDVRWDVIYNYSGITVLVTETYISRPTLFRLAFLWHANGDLYILLLYYYIYTFKCCYTAPHIVVLTRRSSVSTVVFTVHSFGPSMTFLNPRSSCTVRSSINWQTKLSLLKETRRLSACVVLRTRRYGGMLS